MADRTKDEIIDQMTFALASVYQHYGTGHNSDGLRDLREEMAALYERDKLFLDASFTCDVFDDDTYADFHQRIIQPNGWRMRTFDEYFEDLKENP